MQSEGRRVNEAVLDRDLGIERLAPGLTCEEREVGANVTALSVGSGSMAFGLGDGRLGTWGEEVQGLPHRHAGAVTGLLGIGETLVSAGQDGAVLQSGPSGEVSTLRAPGDVWITMLAHDRAASRVAAAHERAVTVFARDGATVASFSDHPSTVTGVEIGRAHV